MNFDQPHIDTREFGTEPSICPHCQADLADDCHARWCRSSLDFFEPDYPDVGPDFGLGE
jgi:hypothetical protein